MIIVHTIEHIKKILQRGGGKLTSELKTEIYKQDFLLKEQSDQFAAIFKTSGAKKAADLIPNPEGRALWITLFGDKTVFVPWEEFFPKFIEAQGQPSFKNPNFEKVIKLFLDFTRDDYVSAYEFSIFLKWFGPLQDCCLRLLKALEEGLLAGFVPALEAKLLLETNGTLEGTFLIRFSKTHPGSFAVTFVDTHKQIKHCLLHSVEPTGMTLKNPPNVYGSLLDFAKSHEGKLKFPVGNKFMRETMEEIEKGRKASSNCLTANISSRPENSPSPNLKKRPKKDNENGLEISGDEEEKAFYKDKDTCVICLDAPRATVFLDCGHMACCVGCSTKVEQCPICRQDIARIVKIGRAHV